jgi:tyrosine-protein kinase Etk/Wzc
MSFLIKTLITWRRLLAACFVAGVVLMAIIAFSLPRWYRATTTLFPPESSGVLSVSEELVRRLATPLLGAVATGASPGAVCVDVLGSRAVGEQLIAEFGLMEAYDTGTIEECLDALHSHTDLSFHENGILVVSFEDRDPRRAAEIANRMVGLLDGVMRDIKISRAARTREFIEQQMLERRELLSRAEDEFRAFQEKSHMVDVEEQLAATMDLVTELTARAISLEIEMKIAAHHTSTSSQQYRRMQAEYDGVVEQLGKLKGGEADSTSSAAGALAPSLAEVPAAALQYGRLQRALEVQTRVYKLLVTEYEKASIEAVRDTPLIQVLDRAEIPTQHARPRRGLLILVGGALELVWSVALVLLMTFWRERRPRALAVRELLGPIMDDFARLRPRRGNPAAPRPASRSAVLLLLAFSVLPLLAWCGLRLTGYDSLLPLAATAFVAAAIAAVLMVRPLWGVYALVFWVYSGVGSYAPIDAAPPLLVLILAASVLALIRGASDRMTDRLFLTATGVFVLFSLQSALFAHNPLLTFRELFTLAKVLAVVVVIVQLVRTPVQLRNLAYVAFAGAVATVAIGVVAIQTGLAGLSYIGGVDVLRFSGAHGDPNKAASIMCSALPFGFFAVHSERGFRRLLAVVGVVTLIVAIFATFSRGVFFSFAVLVIAFVIREVRSRRSFLVLLALITLGVLLTPSFYWNRALGLTQAFKHTSADWSVYTRLLAFKTGVEMFVHHPLTGVGLGNFIESASYRLFVRIVTHNTYLEIAVGVGIFGLTAFLAMLGAGFQQAWRGVRSGWSRTHAWMTSFSFFSLLSLASIAISGVFLSFPFRYQLWIPVAVGLVIGRLLAEDRSRSGA